MKEQIEKKIKEIEKQFEEGKNAIVKLNSEHKRIMEALTRLQGAYAILKEQSESLKKAKKSK